MMMKNKMAKITLSLLFAVVVFGFFWMTLYPWLVLQKVGKASMVRVDISLERGVHENPIMTLNACSESVRELVRTIRECRNSVLTAKFEAKYLVKVIYSNGSSDLIAVGKDMFSFYPDSEFPQSSCYFWRDTKLYSLIEQITNRAEASTLTTNSLLRAAEVGVKLSSSSIF